MYESIKETISVIGLYDHARFTPKKFLWRGTEYKIEQVTLSADIRDGSVRKRHYAVVVGGTAYRLLFDRAEETWSLEEVWCE